MFLRREKRIGAAHRAAHLTAEDKRAIESIEALYGAPRWSRGDWQAGEPVVSRARPRPARQALKLVVLRTLLLIAAAFLSWYALIGGEASVQRTVSLVLSGIGVARETPRPAEPFTAEYLLAQQTLGLGEVLAPNNPLVLQFKALLDGMSPKCKEDRFALAAALIAAHDALARRGVQEPALAILIQANAALSDQTRGSWPTSCTDVINRVAAAQTPAR